MVFKYNKFLFNKNRLYMGKGCPINGILKMNVMTILQDFSNNNEANSFGYLLESSNLWHDKLEYVNFNSLGKLKNLNLLWNFHINPNHKC